MINGFRLIGAKFKSGLRHHYLALGIQDLALLASDLLNHARRLLDG